MKSRKLLTLSGITDYRIHYRQVTNAVRMLTKIIPNMLEDPAWDGFWWTPTPLGVVVTVPGEEVQMPAASSQPQQDPLAFTLIR